ncbi:MAG TPA: DUF1778 domain-containing protein [Candidatus Acidoferrum sp.]|jgi:uncharacterized protein (DUF1778 family)|nr:DUF1778 domain-containing protein [Candidatus Acidoferrum sp.]
MARALKARRVERVEIRATPEQKRHLERAAEIRGTTLTGFILNEAHEAAMAAINEFEFVQLRNEDRRVFVEALLNPPKPNDALRAAAARHKQLGL